MADAAVVETLTTAFIDDPLMMWLFDDAARRPAQLRVWWAWIIDNRPPHVEVMSTPDDLSAAIWHGPDPAGEGTGASFPDMLAGLVGANEMQRKLPALAVIPEAHPTARHWYLAAIGTRPAHQGEASGPRVLSPVLARCDAAGLPAYLESSNPRNVPFYERFGFVATGIIQVPGGPALTPMWREPDSPRASETGSQDVWRGRRSAASDSSSSVQSATPA
jgi:GNAT superfamily N-acetyltransferase